MTRTHRYHLRGECRYGNHCNYVHGLRCGRCGQNAVHPTDALAAAAHEHACSRVAQRKEELAASERAVCGICWDRPSESGTKLFGLLENCTHSFCLACIREWRSSECSARRACPVCRKESFLVIPCETLESDPVVKKHVVDVYKRTLANIPCKYFAYGSGDCPFQDNCLYAHNNINIDLDIDLDIDTINIGINCIELYDEDDHDHIAEIIDGDNVDSNNLNRISSS